MMSEAAARALPSAALEPGFCYCEGLLKRYLNAPAEALRALNKARRDGVWGDAAAVAMAGAAFTVTGPSKSAAECRFDLSFGATTAFSSVPAPWLLPDPLEPDFLGRFFFSLSLLFSGAGFGFFFFSSWYMLR